MENPFLYFVLFLILVAEFINGWTDAPNAIATVVSTRTLSPRKAIFLASFLNIMGSLSGTAVATTIGKGIISADLINLATVAAAVSSIILWGICTWYFGLPTSKSHALVSGLAGAGIASAGPDALIWGGLNKVLIGLVFSTVCGLSLGWMVAQIVQRSFLHASPNKARRLFSRLQVFSASLMAFSHGSNDGQKFIGAFALTLMLGGWTNEFTIPFWVVILCAVVMGLGTSLGGMRIIQTMGYKMLRLETYQGFSAEAAAATTIVIASKLGVPLSTTHTISTSILGVGIARNASMVRWIVVRQIITAWILTFPVCGLLSYAIAKLFKFLAWGV
ncbi:MAG: inorganic phosphate transporter [Oligoflexales bacterium]|nr:inorganic phosphate transporter [Oligoflexales bacterium]